MDGSAAVEIEWQGRQHFRLPIGRLREIQALRGVGPALIFDRLARGHWRSADVRETLRIGLVGGGMPRALAGDLVAQATAPGAWRTNVEAAALVLMAGLSGPKDDAVPAARIDPDAPAAEADGNPDRLIDFRHLYGTGAVLGFSPRDVDEMSIWEFGAAVKAWNKAQGGEDEKPPAMTDTEFDEMLARHGVDGTAPSDATSRQPRAGGA